MLAWLAEEGLDELVSVFKSNNIDGPELLALNKDTLAKELHIGERKPLLFLCGQ